MTGTIELNGQKTEVVVFPNDKGDNPARPDYRILLSKPRDQQAAPAGGGYDPGKDSNVPF